jgi:two-component system, OmpR family, sensor histidine kinase KdpD
LRNISFNWIIHVERMKTRANLRSGLRHSISIALRIVIIGGVLALLSLSYTAFIRVNLATIAVSFLLVVLISATRWGLAESLAASIIAAFCFNFFFIPPSHSLWITHAQDWVAFLAFLATSIIVSQLSARLKRRTTETLASRSEIEKLYAVSRAMLLMDSSGDVREFIAEQIAKIFALRSVVLHEEGRLRPVRAGPEEMTGIELRLHGAATEGLFFEDGIGQTAVVPIFRAGKPIAALGVSGLLLSAEALNALSNLVAIGLEMASAQYTAARAEATRESQELKSALLDAIAHEFKSPLATIRAATTSVLGNFLSRPEDVKDVLTVIDTETERLGRLVTDVIQTARIEAGEIQLRKQPQRVDQIISLALEEMTTRTDGRVITLSLSQPLTTVSCDAGLIQLLLRQLVDNALKYSPPSSPIEIMVNSTEQHLVVCVADRGPGIPEAEQSRIFERFYRLEGHRQRIPGSGMGLTIARYIAQAHGGAVGTSSREGGGSVFWLSLPISPEEAVK